MLQGKGVSLKAQARPGQCAGSRVSLQDNRQAHRGTLLLEIAHDLLQLLHAFILLVGPLAGIALCLCAIVKYLSGTLTSALTSHNTQHERWSTQFKVEATCLPALHASASSLPQQASSVQGMALHRYVDEHAFGADDGGLQALYLVLQAVPLLPQCLQLLAHPCARRLRSPGTKQVRVISMLTMSEGVTRLLVL